jgi:hypothetical protein
MHGNSHCSLKAPSLFSWREIFTLTWFIHSLQQMSASGPKYVARMASRLFILDKLWSRTFIASAHGDMFRNPPRENPGYSS